MSDQPASSGFRYFTTYSGVLKLFEEMVNIIVIILLTFNESTIKSTILNIIAIYALVITLILIILHILNAIHTTFVPWLWIECVHGLVSCGLYTLASILVLITLEKALIIAGIVGIIGAVIYCLDMLDKYRMAMVPRAQWGWNQPNMEEEDLTV